MPPRTLRFGGKLSENLAEVPAEPEIVRAKNQVAGHRRRQIH
jgi:hypothetical protein